jgi:hypothetical protein
MYKVMWLMKRQAHLTHQQFRDHFEASHAPMAQKYCGHLFTDYRRNYVDQVWSGGDPRLEPAAYGPRAWSWDLISEWTTATEADFHDILRIMDEPAIRQEFWDDEDRFIDRTATVMIPCEERETGTGDGHAAPWPRGSSGQT